MSPCCPDCNFEETVLVGEILPSSNFAGNDLDSVIPGGKLFRCSDCSLLFRWPRMSKAEADELYKNGNYEVWGTGPFERNDWKIAINWLNNNITNGSILDIGCSTGGFLGLLGEGWDRAGAEIERSAADKARGKGVRILAEDLEQLENLQERFDVITAFDVIEHLESPLSFLGHMLKLSSDNGVIIVSTGDTDSFMWKLLGSRNLYCITSGHISFINESWCVMAARKSGLKIEFIDRFSHKAVPSTIFSVIGDFIMNAFYKFVTGLFVKLRTMGFGSLDVKTHGFLGLYPPPWKTAKDHFLVVFRKI